MLKVYTSCKRFRLDCSPRRMAWIFMCINKNWWIYQCFMVNLCFLWFVQKQFCTHKPGPGLWKLPPHLKTFSMFRQVLFPRQEKQENRKEECFLNVVAYIFYQRLVLEMGTYAWFWKHYTYGILHVEKVRHLNNSFVPHNHERKVLTGTQPKAIAT